MKTNDAYFVTEADPYDVWERLYKIVMALVADPSIIQERLENVQKDLSSLKLEHLPPHCRLVYERILSAPEGRGWRAVPTAEAIDLAKDILQIKTEIDFRLMFPREDWSLVWDLD